jgi:hypothetical protein
MKGQGRCQPSRNRRPIPSRRDHRPSRHDRNPASDGVGEAVALKGWMKRELVWIIAAIIVILVLAAIGYLARLA